MIREIHNDLLFVGNAIDARDLRVLRDNRIAGVVDLAMNELPAQLARDMIYCRIPIVDGDGNADAMVETAIRSTVMLVRNGIRTLVACSAGMSRAPSVGAAAVAVLTRQDPDDCLREIIAEAPNDISPTLWSQVKSVCHRVSAKGASHDG